MKTVRGGEGGKGSGGEERGGQTGLVSCSLK